MQCIVREEFCESTFWGYELSNNYAVPETAYMQLMTSFPPRQSGKTDVDERTEGKEKNEGDAEQGDVMSSSSRTTITAKSRLVGNLNKISRPLRGVKDPRVIESTDTLHRLPRKAKAIVLISDPLDALLSHYNHICILQKYRIIGSKVLHFFFRMKWRHM